MHTFKTDAAYLVGTCLGSFFWGIFTAVFILFIFIMRGKRGRELYSVPNIAVLAMYLLATGFWSLSMSRLFEAFITFRDSVDPGTYYLVQGNIHPGLNFGQVWVYSVITIVGDSVLVWRCHVVWGRRFWFITLIPALMVLATAIGGFGAPSVTLRLSTASPQLAEDFAPLAARFAEMEIVTSMLTNLVTTILIGGRIWWVSTRNVDGTRTAFKSNRFANVISLVVESGTLITALKIIEFTTYRVAIADVDNIAEEFWMVWSCVPQVVGIVPTLIIIVVTTGHTSTTSTTMASTKSTLVFAARKPNSSSGRTPTTVSGITGIESIPSPGMDSEAMELRSKEA